jgi:hypothetical protein
MPGRFLRGSYSIFPIGQLAVQVRVGAVLLPL